MGSVNIAFGRCPPPLATDTQVEDSRHTPQRKGKRRMERRRSLPPSLLGSLESYKRRKGKRSKRLKLRASPRSPEAPSHTHLVGVPEGDLDRAPRHDAGGLWCRRRSSCLSRATSEDASPPEQLPQQQPQQQRLLPAQPLHGLDLGSACGRTGVKGKRRRLRRAFEIPPRP